MFKKGPLKCVYWFKNQSEHVFLDFSAHYTNENWPPSFHKNKKKAFVNICDY
jgi:hypothetical protein